MPPSLAIDSAQPNAPLDANGTRADMGALPFDPLHCGAGCDGMLGTVYCTSNPNSTGQASHIRALGSTNLLQDQLILHASGMPAGMPGYFLGSKGIDNIPGFGGSDGVLCLGLPLIVRFNLVVSNTGASGEFTRLLTPNTFPDGHFIAHAETWHFQAWHRDYNGITPTSNTSDALSITFP